MSIKHFLELKEFFLKERIKVFCSIHGLSSQGAVCEMDAEILAYAILKDLETMSVEQIANYLVSDDPVVRELAQMHYNELVREINNV